MWIPLSLAGKDSIQLNTINLYSYVYFIGKNYLDHYKS